MKVGAPRQHAKATLALAVALGLALPAAANNPKQPRRLAWQAKHVAGADAAPNQKFRLTFEGQQLVCAAGKQVPLSIPLQGIRQVYTLDGRPRRPLVAGLRTAGVFPREVLSSPSAGQGDAAFLMTYMIFGFVPTWAIASAFHNRAKYLVTIVWEDDGAERQATLRFSAKEYAAFLPALENVTHKEWPNLVKLQQRLVDEKDNRVKFRLAIAMRVGTYALKPGAYQAVLLEGEGNQGDLYFLRGTSPTSKRIEAAVPVEIRRDDSASAVRPFAAEAIDGAATITAVRLAGKVLRLKVNPQVPVQ